MVCPKCGTKYTGNRCPECKHWTTDDEKDRSNRRKYGLLGGGLVLFLTLLGIIWVLYDTNSFFGSLETQFNDIYDEDGNHSTMGSNSTNSAVIIQTDASHSDKDDIKEEAQKILEEFYSSEEILSIRPQETKIEVQISSPVLSSQGAPEDWAEIQGRAKSACSQLKSDLGEESFSSYILYLVDPENVNLLSVMGDEVKYDVFGDNDFSVPVDNPGTISLEEFNAIKTGMTYQEVFDIVGSRGEVLSEVDLGLGDEYYTAMYTWDGEGSLGANANVTFQGGKVTSKAQFGLE